MTTLDKPTSDRASWRVPEPADADGMAAHTKLIHEAERLNFLPGPDFFRWMLEQPGVNPADDVRIGEHDGLVVADCGTWLHSADRGARCVIWAEASPGFEDLRASMLEWTIARAQQRLEPEGAPRVIRISAEEHRTGLRSAIEAAGFAHMRAFADMARPLADLPPLPTVAAQIQIVPWSDELEDSTRLASNESFRDHWGSLPMTADEFRGFFRDSPTFRPDLSFLAVDDGEVVSFSLCEVDDGDNAERETNDVYIQRVGTVASHRGSGLASHLMVRSMQAAAATGSLDRAALDVDEMSHTNATVVYERLGFETYDRSFSYFIELDPD